MSNRKIDKLLLKDTIAMNLSPDFHTRITYRNKDRFYNIRVLSPNETLGARLLVSRDILKEPSVFDTVGRMVSHAFTNKAWEML